jgi:hypothetical protein
MYLRRATGPLVAAAKAEIVWKKKLFMVEIRPFPLERGAQKDPDNVCPKQAEQVS